MKVRSGPARRIVARAAVCILAWGMVDGAVVAATYPWRPLRWVVPFTPGGSADAVARVVARGLSESLGQQVVVDNRPGGSTAIAAALVAHSTADGHTLFQASASVAINASLRANLGYDVSRDFAPVSLITTTPNLLVVNPRVSAKSVRELVALARSKPGWLNYGSAGKGSGNHLAGELFRLSADINIVHVPYRGDAPAVTDLVGGEVHMLFIAAAPVLGHIDAGRLRALAVTGTTRSPLYPDLPTVAESGVPGFQSSSWQGLLVPAATPRDYIQRLYTELRAVLSRESVRSQLRTMGLQGVGDSPEHFGAFMSDEIARWGKVIREASIKVD